MEERRIGRYFHPPTNTDWQVVEWGSVERTKNIEENRLTRSGIQGSTHTTFAIEYPNGEVRHLTFSGHLPTDLDTLADYWVENDSL